MPDAASELLVLALAAVALSAIGIRIVLRSRVTPAERERRRRLTVHRMGRIGSATIVETRDEVLYYSYEVGGVACSATQNVSALREHLPVEAMRLIGPATIKYHPRNPANSIVVCEEWSGLRDPRIFHNVNQGELIS